MLITIKNTFIDVIEENIRQSVARARSKSLHWDYPSERMISGEDSGSTAPTVCSPSTGPRIPTQQILVTILHSEFAFSLEAFRKFLKDDGLLDQVAEIEIVSETEHHTSVSIKLKSPDYAMSLFQLLHGEEFAGCRIFVETADATMSIVSPESVSVSNESPRRGPVATTKLFIGGLKSSTHCRALREYMQKFGEIKDCGIVYDFKGVSRRFGYCEYWMEESVLSVLDFGQHYIESQRVGIRPYRLRE